MAPPIEAYPAKNVTKNFVSAKFGQIFKLSHPTALEGGAENMYNPCIWLSFVKQKKNFKNRKLKFLLMKIISTVLKLLFLKTTVLFTLYQIPEYADNESIMNLG